MTWDAITLGGWLGRTAVGGGFLLLLVWGMMRFPRQPVRRQHLGEWGVFAALLLAALCLGPAWLPGRILSPADLLFDFAPWQGQVLAGSVDYAPLPKALLKQASDALGADYDVATHFTPSYYPWEQRLCLVPDADLFVAILLLR
jgi:hypothetical protein